MPNLRKSIRAQRPLAKSAYRPLLKSWKDSPAPTACRVEAGAVGGAGQDVLFQFDRGGDRHVGRAHPPDRGFQGVQAVFGHQGGDFGPHPAGHAGLLHDHQPPGLAHRGEDRGAVQRLEAHQIHHFQADAAGSKGLAQRQADRHHGRIGHHCHLVARRHHGLIQPQDELAGRHRTPLGVQPLVLDEDHGIGVANRALQQPLGLGGVRGGYHLDARHPDEQVAQHLRMARTIAALGPARGAHHQGDVHLPIVHIVQFAGGIEDLVQGQGDEVHEHDLHHRAQAHHRRAHGHADEAVLGDRRFLDADRAVLFEELAGHPEGPAVEPDVLADQDHVRIAGKLLVEGLVDRLGIEDLA